MSIKDIETFHINYAKLKRDTELVEMMADEYELKRSCLSDSGGDDSYLKKPLSYVRDDPEKEAALYANYVEHSFLPENIVSDAREEMTGVCFKSAATVILPDKIKHLEFHANTRGDSLMSVSEQVLRDLIMSKRGPISTDYDHISDRSYIQHKESKTLINWRKSSSGYTMMVFAESYIDEEGKNKEQRRHYSIEGENKTLEVKVYRNESNGAWGEHLELDENGKEIPPPSLPNNKPYTYIPVRVPETIKPALLGMARAVWKGFKISADYFGMLHKLTPTLVIKSDSSAEALNVGFENGVKIGVNDDIELLQQTTDGAAPLKEAMEGMFNSAVDQGVRLVSESSNRESEGALYLRNANKQIKMDSVAREASKQIEEALRVAAILENANPDDVRFSLKVELVRNPVNIEELKEMREAVVESSLVKWSDYILRLESDGLIELDRRDDGGFDVKKYMSEVVEELAILDREDDPETVI